MRAARQALLRLDRPWLPQAPGYSMYIRPVAFSSAGSLGMAPPARTTLMILLSPAGPYFETGAPLRLLAGGGGDGCERVCSCTLPLRACRRRSRLPMSAAVLKCALLARRAAQLQTPRAEPCSYPWLVRFCTKSSSQRHPTPLCPMSRERGSAIESSAPGARPRGRPAAGAAVRGRGERARVARRRRRQQGRLQLRACHPDAGRRLPAAWHAAGAAPQISLMQQWSLQIGARASLARSHAVAEAWGSLGPATPASLKTAPRGLRAAEGSAAWRALACAGQRMRVVYREAPADPKLKALVT